MLAAGGAGALVWYMRDDDPPPVSLERATDRSKGTNPSADTPGDEGDRATTRPDRGPSAEDVEGTWTVESDAGSFSLDDTSATFVGFRVDEELTIGSATAVGRTPLVEGTVTIEDGVVRSAVFEADLRGIRTDRPRRDPRVQEALETERFPTARFELTEPIDLRELQVEDGEVSVVARGEMTIHGVTKTVDFPLRAKLDQGQIVVVGSTEVVFADYGVTPPSAPIVISVEDHGLIEVQLRLSRQSPAVSSAG